MVGMAIADGVSLLLVNRVCHPPALLDSRPEMCAWTNANLVRLAGGKGSSSRCFLLDTDESSHKLGRAGYESGGAGLTIASEHEGRVRQRGSISEGGEGTSLEAREVL